MGRALTGFFRYYVHVSSIRSIPTESHTCMRAMQAATLMSAKAFSARLWVAGDEAHSTSPNWSSGS